MTIGDATIPVLSLFIIAVALSLMVGLQLFVGRTRIGRSMRSTALDRDAAALMGVNINRTIAITFLIGSALAGAAGVTFGLQYGVTNARSASTRACARSPRPSSVASGTRSARRSAGSSSGSSRWAPPSRATTAGAAPSCSASS